MRRDWKFYAQLGLTIVLCLFIVVPVVMSALAGVTVNVFKGLSSGLTLRWVFEVWDLYAQSILLSLGIAMACLVVTLVAGVPLAYVLVRRPSRMMRLFLITYGGVSGYRSSWLFILTGHVLFTLPFMVRSVAAVMAAMDMKMLEEGAASLGAGFWRRFFGVIVPNAKPGILAGALMVVTLSIGEFNLTWMLHTPLTKTLPVGLADAYASMRLEIGSAYTLIFFVLIMPLLIAMQALADRGKRASRRIDTAEDTL